MKVVVVPVTPFEQNCTLLIGDDGTAAVTDPGGDIERILAAAKQHGARIEKILLTHGHVDHCAAADALRTQLGVPIEGPQKDEAFWIDQLPAQSQRFGFPPAKAFVPDRWLEDGDTVEAAGRTLQVFHCPGHTPGHVVFFSAQDRVAIVGDVLFAGSIGRTDFPRGNHADLINAITQKLWPLGDDVTFIPGHGATSQFGYERKTNMFVADDILAAR